MLREAFSLAENAYLTWIPTWRMLADALAKLVCGSMLRATLSGQRFTASPPVKRESASAKMPTRAPSALAGQVVKTLVASSLVRPATASSEAVEAFAYLGDLYLVTIMILGLYIAIITITTFVLYMQFMGKTTTSTTPMARSTNVNAARHRRTLRNAVASHT